MVIPGAAVSCRRYRCRRMFAGGRFEFHRPLKIGDEITRTSRITDVSGKEGRSGTLVFVTVRHEIANAPRVWR